jgi:hypothetical protein
MPVKQWKLLSARLRCHYCGNTIYMVYKGRWSIHKAVSTLDYAGKAGQNTGNDDEFGVSNPPAPVTDSITPQSPLSMSPEDASEKDEGQEHSDG